MESLYLLFLRAHLLVSAVQKCLSRGSSDSGPDKRKKGPADSGDGLRCQMPAYHAYPSSAPNKPEPKPLPNCLRLSVIVRRVMYLTFL